jgi:hypothetical protein
MKAILPVSAFQAIHPARQLSESPSFRACRRRTAELLADKHRLGFLRALDLFAAPLTAAEAGFVQSLLERSRRRRYHYVFSIRERDLCDALRRSYGAQLPKSANL